MAKNNKNKIKQVICFPLKVLQPLIKFLKREEKRLKKVEKNLEKEDPFNDPGRVDDNAIDTDVSEQVEHERVSATKMAINRSLVSVRKTLTRIKLGRYGICEECHKMIDTDRLAIDLTAEYCVKCAVKKENSKK
ncbi:TraR/DksA C4-type zinc finger protein [Patescibacteria group bacterium]|nr:TraR/DksA C4-type zinc finger protein [Patescibacteria group bacterium]